MELSDTVVYLKVVKQSNCIELFACGVFLKNERNNLEWNAFLLSDYPLDRETGLPVHR